MKNITSMILAALLGVTMLAGCSSNNGGSASASSAENTPNQVEDSADEGEVAAEDIAEGEAFTVGLIQLMEHPSLDEIRTAITDRLSAEAASRGYTVTIDYQNAQNDTSLINSICRQFVNDKVDVIVAIATPAAQGAATATSDIPIVFSAVTDPISAGLIEDMESPEANITGTSDAIDIGRIFDLADELTPGISRYGFIYNKGETNSVSVIEQAKEYMDAKGVTYTEKTVTNAGEVQQTARALLEDCDAVFAPIDNTVASAMNVLADEAIGAGKPVYVAADSMVNDGGLATVGVNYTNLGTQTADMVIRILDGAAVGEVPVEVLTDVGVVVNAETAGALGVDVSKYAE